MRPCNGRFFVYNEVIRWAFFMVTGVFYAAQIFR